MAYIHVILVGDSKDFYVALPYHESKAISKDVETSINNGDVIILRFVCCSHIKTLQSLIREQKTQKASILADSVRHGFRARKHLHL